MQGEFGFGLELLYWNSSLGAASMVVSGLFLLNTKCNDNKCNKRLHDIFEDYCKSSKI